LIVKQYDKGSFLLFLALGYFCIINADAPYFFNLESFLPFFLPQVFSMKKTFNFSHPKKQRPRVVEAIKYELKKYIKRERNKKRPEEVDF
jgi:hypothetical protein